MHKQDHITEEKLDKFAAMPDLLDENERFSIKKHISDCTLCKEYFERISSFYNELERRSGEPATDKDRELAYAVLKNKRSKLLQSGALEEKKFGSLIETYTGIATVSRRTSLPQRIVRFVQTRPVASAAVMFAVIAFFTVPFLYVQKTGDTNPAFARVENYQLRVYNRDAELLWTKTALGIPDLSSAPWKMSREDSRRYLMVEDIDGSGVKEVLLLYPSDERFDNDTLACYNFDGSLRWKGELPEPIVFGEKDQTRFINWDVRDFISLRKNQNHRKQLFVIARSRSYPGILFELDTKNGTILQTYWNTGHINIVMAFDVHSDGNTDIILGGINNPFERAFVAVLDPLNINGYGPTQAEDIPRGIQKAIEMFYILFPKTSISKSLGTVSFNSVGSIFITSGPAISVHIQDIPSSVDGTSAPVIFNFDDTMKIQSVTHAAPFRALHRRLVDEGILDETLDDEYWENLKNSVLYWDGERFVNEPVMNRIYVERFPS